jgi:glycosyltransferase involved in cell wall biosynthesis
MRLAHFVQRYPPALGGSEAFFARLSRYLAAQQHRVSVYTSNALALEAFWSPRGTCLPAGITEENCVEVRRYPLWRLRGRRFLLKPLSLLPHRRWQCLTLPCNPISFSMWADAGKSDPPFDLVHATAFPYAFPIICAQRLAWQLDVPFLVTPFLHLGDPEDSHDKTRHAYTTPALLSLLRTADRVFVQTELERTALLDLGLLEKRLVLLGMGVDLDECQGGDRARARGEWGVAAEEVVIGHLANNSVEKGTVDLLRAAQMLWEAGAPFTIVLAGPEMSNFRRFWQDFSPRGTVVKLGVLDERQKRDFFAALDLFALPSRSDSFGLVLLEAWANGVPCVGYRAGGIAEVIRHQEDGWLVRCGNVGNLAEALRRLIEQPSERRRLGQSGRERLPREFHWPDKLRRVEEVYRDAVEEKKGPRAAARGL